MVVMLTRALVARQPRLVHGEVVQLITIGAVSRVVCHLEHHPHVVRGALAANFAVQISIRRGGDEVVVMSRLEFQTARSWRERSECDGEVEHLVRLVAHGDHLGSAGGDAAVLVFLLADIVDDVALSLCAPWIGALVHRADDVGLVILPRKISSIDIHNVVRVVNPEDWI